MAKIILSKYDDGEDHIVVGYDRPLQTFFWQEFAPEPEGPVEDGWDPMIGFAGFNPRELPTVQDLFNHAVTHNERVGKLLLKHDPQVVTLLFEHQKLNYPASNVIVDLSTKE